MPDILVGMSGLDLLLFLGVGASVVLIAREAWGVACARR